MLRMSPTASLSYCPRSRGETASQFYYRKVWAVDSPRYPKETKASRAALAASGWRSAIADKKHGYSSMWSGLAKAAKGASSPDTSKSLWLLADACSPMLQADSANHPFKPEFRSSDGRRSPLPDDFANDDLVFFHDILNDIDDPWLQGRLADMLWLVQSPRDPEVALVAIDAYRRIPISRETWKCGGRECWRRAAGLARLLNSGAGDRVTDIADILWSSCQAATTADGLLAPWIADVLLEHRLLGRDRLVPLANQLRSSAQELMAANDFQMVRTFLNRAIHLYTLASADDLAADALLELVESWTLDADKSAGTLGEAGSVETAIQVLRRIPRKHRDVRNIDDRISKLRERLPRAGENALGQLAPMASDPFDIGEMVATARDAVRGKSALDAMGAFAGIYNIRVADIRAAAAKVAADYPMSHIFPATFLSDDGRVIAKSSSIDPTDDFNSDDNSGVRLAMIRHYGTLRDLAAQAYVLPALQVLQLEHRLCRIDFRAMAAHSGVIPPGRADIVGDGLYAGYEGDFVAAVHILAPQLEYMVRHHLKANGAITTTLDAAGIENVNGLSTLVNLPQMLDVFGPDQTFEIRANFCDPFGPNIRNEVAHGLMDWRACQSPSSIYAWWFCLRLVFIDFWARSRGRRENTGG